jgi:Na+-transporting NADH:ubiquinone oxidoreductase subunit B
VDGLTSATPCCPIAATEPGAGLVDLPFTWTQAFVGIIPGSMGETSALACLLGAGLLLLTGIASWRIMGAMLLGGILTALMLTHLPDPSNGLYTLPVHWHLVLGGFAFGLVFMATDPVSAAQTPTGQWLYGGLYRRAGHSDPHR